MAVMVAVCCQMGYPIPQQNGVVKSRITLDEIQFKLFFASENSDINLTK